MTSMLLSLTPSESKRLIAKAVCEIPQVKERMKSGQIAISTGSTAAFVAEELLGEEINKEKFPCGVISNGRICRTSMERTGTILIKDGIRVENQEEKDDARRCADFYQHFSEEDIYIKGANAIDRLGNAGFLIANPAGGNLLQFARYHATRGVSFIIPAGLEKLVNSVREAQLAVKGQQGYTFSFGRPCGYYSVNNGLIVTEIEAVKILTGAEATHVASGGIGGSEGSVVLSVSGEKEAIEKLYYIIKQIKGEPPVQDWKMSCRHCDKGCSYPVRASHAKPPQQVVN